MHERKSCVCTRGKGDENAEGGRFRLLGLQPDKIFSKSVAEDGCGGQARRTLTSRPLSLPGPAIKTPGCCCRRVHDREFVCRRAVALNNRHNYIFPARYGK